MALSDTTQTQSLILLSLFLFTFLVFKRELTLSDITKIFFYLNYFFERHFFANIVWVSKNSHFLKLNSQETSYFS